MPEATVAAIVMVEKKSMVRAGKVLLTRRRIEPFKGQWCLPGGHIDRFEYSRDAIIREVKEETGLDLDPRFFGHFDEIIPSKNIHAVVLVYEGTASGTLNPQESEVTDIGWFTMEEARSLPLAFTHNSILDEFAAKER